MDSLTPAVTRGGHEQVLERMQRSVDSLTGILDTLLDVARQYGWQWRVFEPVFRSVAKEPNS